MNYPTIRALDGDHCLAVWDCVAIQIWRGVCTEKASLDGYEVVEGLLSSMGGRGCFLSVVEASSPPPDQGARQVFAKLSRDLIPSMAVAIIVAEGSGFRAAIVRGVGTGLSLLTPHRVPFRFLADVEEAAKELEPHLRTGGAHQLLGVIADLRGRIQRSQLSRERLERPR